MTQRMENALARIYRSDNTVVGAGLLVTPRHVLTCAHVVAAGLNLRGDLAQPPTDPIRLDFPLGAKGKQSILARVVVWQPPQADGGGDIAGLELLSAPPDDLRPEGLVPLSYHWNHPFRAFGFSANHEGGVWAEGHIQGQQSYGWIQMVCGDGYLIEPGFSGTPVWDTEQSGVVGIAVAAEKSAQAGYMIPARVLIDAWPLLEDQIIPPFSADGPYYFISYSRANKGIVERLLADLKQAGVNVWIDKQGLKAGTRNWEQALRDAISGAQAVILLASPESRRSNYVQDELSIAEMYKRPLYPVWGAGEHWIDCIPMGLGKMQYVDVRSDRYAAGLRELAEALGNRLSQPTIEAAPPTLPRDFKPRNPYKGLRAFDSSDKGDFFGRDGLIRTLAEHLDKARFLAVIGPSGSGKSSVVKAGLLPTLQAAHPDWVFMPELVPGANPVERLSLSLFEQFGGSLADIGKDLETLPGSRGLHLRIGPFVKKPGTRVVLFIDQFEELFTLTTSDDERQRYIDLLTTAVTEPDGALTVILTLRADFDDRPMAYADLLRLLDAHRQSVPPLTLTDLRDVIEKPAALPDVQMTFEDGLIAELVFEVRDQVGGLPLLQFTLDQLFERCKDSPDHRLTYAAYREIGGLRGALTKHAEATYAALPTDEHRTLTRSMFLRLIEPGATEQDTTRRRAARSEFELADPGQTRIMRECRDAFIKARLLTTNDTAGLTTIEVSHEALIREWTRLGDWLKNARDDVRLQKIIAQDAARWSSGGSSLDADALYRGTVLLDAQDWIKRNIASASETAFVEGSAKRQEAVLALEEQRKRELLQASQQAEQSQREANSAAERAEGALHVAQKATRRSVRAQRIAVVVGLVTGLIVVLAAIGVLSAQSAVTQANATLGPVPATLTAAQGLANQSQRDAYAAATQVALAGQTLTPVPLTLQAGNDRLNSAGTAINQANAQAATAQTGVAVVARTLTQVPLTLQAGNDRLNSASTAINQANAQAATAQTSVAVAAHTLTQVPVTLTAQAGKVQAGQTTLTSVAQSAAEVEKRVAALQQVANANAILQTNGGDPELAALLSIYALRTQYSDQAGAVLALAMQQINNSAQVFKGQTALTASLALSPDGAFLATGGVDGNLFVFDVASGKMLFKTSDHTAQINALAFSPDGTQLATASDDKTAILWDAHTGQKALTFSGHTDKVLAIVFSPDGTSVATGSADKTAILWDAHTGSPIKTFTKHTDAVTAVGFSQDGKRFLTTGRDNFAYVWDPATGQTTSEIKAPSGIEHAIFSPNGKYMLSSSRSYSFSGSADFTARLTNLDDATGFTLSGHHDFVSALAFSPDGKYLLTGSLDKTMILWDRQSGRLIRSFAAQQNGVTGVAFSPDGRFIFNSGDQGVRERYADGGPGMSLLEFVGHTKGITATAYSPDGKYLVTGSEDGTTRLWDVTTGQQAQIFNQTDQVESVAFSPNGPFLATGTSKGAVLVWNTETGQQMRSLAGHTDSVFGLAFSPDGARLVASGFDTKVIVWDIRSGAPLNTFQDAEIPGLPIYSVAFAPDGRSVFIVGIGNPVEQIDLQTGKEIRAFGKSSGLVIKQIAVSPNGRLIAAPLDTTVTIWDIQTGGNVQTLTQGAQLFSVGFSPDSSQLVVGTADGAIDVWDIATAKPLRTLRGHTQSVVSVGFSPDGKYIYSGSIDTTARLWLADYRDLAENACTRVSRDFTDVERKQFGITSTAPTCPQFGTQLIALLPTTTTYPLPTQPAPILLDTPTPGIQPTRTPIPTVTPQLTPSQPSSQKSGTLKYVSAGFAATQGDVKLSDFTVSVQMHNPDKADSFTYWEAGFFFRTRFFVLVDVKNGQVTWSLDGTGTSLVPFSTGPIADFDTSANAVNTLTLTAQGSAGTLDVNGSTVGTFDLSQSSTAGFVALVVACDAAHVGQSVAYENFSLGAVIPPGAAPEVNATHIPVAENTPAAPLKFKTITSANARQLQALTTFSGHTDDVAVLAFSPDGKLLASGSRDNTVRLWHGSGQSTVLSGHTGFVNGVAFSPDGATLASGSQDGTIRLWDVQTAKTRTVLKPAAGAVYRVAFSPDGTVLASAQADGTVRLWDTTTQQQVMVLKGHTQLVWSVAFSPDGTVLASGSDDDTIRLWDVKTGNQLSVLQGHVDYIPSLAFSPDGTLLASGSGFKDKTARLWNVSTGQQQALLPHNGLVYSVAFSPDGSLLASTGYADQTLHIWDVKTGKQVAGLNTNGDWIMCLAFAPNGTLLAAAGIGHNITLWGING